MNACDTHGRARLLIGALATLALLATSAAYAQGLPPGADRAKLMQAQQQIQQAGQQLAVIQQKTLEANPKLEAKREKLEKQLFAEMKKHGVTPKEDIARMKELQGQLQKPDTTAEKKQQIFAELQKKNVALRQAQQKAMQAPEVKKAGEAFEKELTAAMKKQDPKAAELLKQLEAAQETLRQALGG